MAVAILDISEELAHSNTPKYKKLTETSGITPIYNSAVTGTYMIKTEEITQPMEHEIENYYI